MKRVRGDLDEGIREYNAFMAEKEERNRVYFRQENFEGMLRNAESMFEWELSPGAEANARAIMDLARRRLAGDVHAHADAPTPPEAVSLGDMQGELGPDRREARHSVTITSPGTLIVEVEAGDPLKVNLDIYDASGTRRLSGDVWGTPASSGRTEQPGLAPGTYVIRVQQAAGHGTYTLRPRFSAIADAEDVTPESAPEIAGQMVVAGGSLASESGHMRIDYEIKAESLTGEPLETHMDREDRRTYKGSISPGPVSISGTVSLPPDPFESGHVRITAAHRERSGGRATPLWDEYRQPVTPGQSHDFNFTGSIPEGARSLEFQINLTGVGQRFYGGAGRATKSYTVRSFVINVEDTR